MIRTAKGKMIDFDDLKARATAKAEQDALANESSGLSRPEDTYIPPASKPKQSAPKKATTKKKSEKQVADDILDDLK